MQDSPAAPGSGICVERLHGSAAAAGCGGPAARAAFRVATDWKGEARSESTVRCCTIGGEEVARSFIILADEPGALLGSDTAPSPQELLISAFNACMVVAYVAQAARRGLTLTACRVETQGELDLRGFLGVDAAVPTGYRRLSYTVTLESDGTRAEHEDIHQAVMATSPNYFSMAQPVQMCGRLA